MLNNNSVTTYTQRDTDEVTTPYASVQYVTGAATSHESALLSDGSRRFDTWDGNLSIGIATNRDKDKLDDHTTLRGRIRNLIYDWRNTITDALLPYHSILNVIESGTTPATAADDNHDVSTITFQLKFQVTPSAWP